MMTTLIAAALSAPNVPAALDCLKRGEWIEGAFFALAGVVLFGFSVLGAAA